MKKAAIISLTIPEIPGKSGGEIRDIYLFKHIAKQYDTDYFSIHNFFGQGEINEEFCSLFKHIYYPRLINEEYHNLISDEVHLSLWEKMRYKLSVAGYYVPFQKIPAEMLGFRNEFNRYMRRFFGKCARERKYDYVFISPQVNPAVVEKLQLSENTKLVWATYDVEKIRHARLMETKKTGIKKWFYRFERAAACKFEEEAVAKVDGIISVSELDRQSFIKFYHLKERKVLSVENGVDIEYFYPMKTEENYSIVFVGNMGYAPNDQATRYFIKDVFSKILKKYPQVHFWAVGANASKELKQLGTDNITITGRVEDVREYLEKAHVVCVPLLAGSGTKYKVLEAMACEKAVITTTYGSEGLGVTHGENIMVAHSSDEIAEYVIELLSNKEKRDRLGKQARKFILDNHAWGVILPKIEMWVERL